MARATRDAVFQIESESKIERPGLVQPRVSSVGYRGMRRPSVPGSATVHRHGAVSGRFCAQPTIEGSRSTTSTWRAGAESQPHAEFRATLCARPRTLHPPIESHRHPLIELARRRGIGNLRVFGSMARGDADTALVVPMREWMAQHCAL